ncbi:MAG: hypothetical protein QF790_07020 [Gammaproteobacteria bacterium]|nr:hypothetical protein [Gammaproteobacteria bacterium]MDP6694541.1 hypothetical protein [Gammaproteobacteria bacterium]
MSASALLAAIFFTGTSFASPDLVSSDSAGVPLEVSDDSAVFGYTPLDISDDGRFILLADYLDAPAIGPVPPPFVEGCSIFRKDRLSGELLTVFEGDPDGIDYCNGALMSADGNLVAA